MKASCIAGIATVLLLVVGTAVAQSPSRVKLPIAEGVWVDTQTRCNAATEAHVHAGGKFGHLYFAEAGAGRTPYDDVIPLLGVVNRKDGFTGVITKFDDGVVQVKAGANGQAIIRAASPSEGEVWRETVRLCAPDSLSTKMRAAVVPFFPNAAAQTKAAPAMAQASKLPLPVGYYAYVEGTFSTCAKPVNIWYFDGTRLWDPEDFSDSKYEFHPRTVKMEMVGNNRFRITYRSLDEDSKPWDSTHEYVITGPQSFAYKKENFRLCQDMQIPAKSRFYKPRK